MRDIGGRIEEVLIDIRPSLGGAYVILKDIDEGAVTLEYYRPGSGNTCSTVVGSGAAAEMRRFVIDTVVERLKEKVPEITEVSFV